MIMASCDAGDALGLAARLTEQLSATSSSSRPAGITVSIGIAQGPAHAMNPRELVACAEAAMMTAKARGKNRIVISRRRRDRAPRPGRTSAGRDVRSIAHLKMLQSLAGKLNRLNDVREIGAAIADRAPAADRLPQLPRRPVVDGRRASSRSRSAATSTRTSEHEVEFPRSKVGEGITGHVAATGESLLLAERDGVRVRGA